MKKRPHTLLHAQQNAYTVGKIINQPPRPVWNIKDSRIIKKLMAFENLTFCDADKLCLKTYIQKEEYVYDPRMFPSPKFPMQPNSNQNNRNITTSHRRLAGFNTNKTKRSYTQVASTSTESNKKRIIHKSFDKNEHNSHLFSPTARPDDKNTFSSFVNDYSRNVHKPEDSAHQNVSLF